MGKITENLFYSSAPIMPKIAEIFKKQKTEGVHVRTDTRCKRWVSVAAEEPEKGVVRWITEIMYEDQKQ